MESKREVVNELFVNLVANGSTIDVLNSQLIACDKLRREFSDVDVSTATVCLCTPENALVLNTEFKRFIAIFDYQKDSTECQVKDLQWLSVAWTLLGSLVDLVGLVSSVSRFPQYDASICNIFSEHDTYADITILLLTCLQSSKEASAKVKKSEQRDSEEVKAFFPTLKQYFWMIISCCECIGHCTKSNDHTRAIFFRAGICITLSIAFDKHMREPLLIKSVCRAASALVSSESSIDTIISNEGSDDIDDVCEAGNFLTTVVAQTFTAGHLCQSLIVALLTHAQHPDVVIEILLLLDALTKISKVSAKQFDESGRFEALIMVIDRYCRFAEKQRKRSNISDVLVVSSKEISKEMHLIDFCDDVEVDRLNFHEAKLSDVPMVEILSMCLRTVYALSTVSSNSAEVLKENTAKLILRIMTMFVKELDVSQPCSAVLSIMIALQRHDWVWKERTIFIVVRSLCKSFVQSRSILSSRLVEKDSKVLLQSMAEVFLCPLKHISETNGTMRRTLMIIMGETHGFCPQLVDSLTKSSSSVVTVCGYSIIGSMCDNKRLWANRTRFQSLSIFKNQDSAISVTKRLQKLNLPNIIERSKTQVLPRQSLSRWKLILIEVFYFAVALGGTMWIWSYSPTINKWINVLK
jgi:hypothetical protein